jgi:hypothetical protein
MDFRFREGTTNAEDDAFAIITSNPVGGQSGAVADNPVDADLVVCGIEGHVRDRRKRPCTPFLKFVIELFV